jgi:5-methylcytosine-specific restriction endonuclease McrA
MRETAEQQRQKARVRVRDNGLCVNCGKQASDVHHIVSRNLLRGKRTIGILWAMYNLCLLCDDCHTKGNTRPMRNHLLHVMADKYGYLAEYLVEPEFASRFLDG